MGLGGVFFKKNSLFLVGRRLLRGGGCLRAYAFDSLGQVNFLAWHSLGLALGNCVAGTLLQKVSAKPSLLLTLSLSMLCNFILGAVSGGQIWLSKHI